MIFKKWGFSHFIFVVLSFIYSKTHKERYFKIISLGNPPLKPLRAHCRNCRLINAKLFYIF
ncbi:hypothetical protein EC516_06435 [Helicobacter pylori]|nr:hypothetical protein EC516_06435 [Helicobacter pylori]